MAPTFSITTICKLVLQAASCRKKGRCVRAIKNSNKPSSQVRKDTVPHELAKAWHVDYAKHILRAVHYKGTRIDKQGCPVRVPWNGLTFPGFLLTVTLMIRFGGVEPFCFFLLCLPRWLPFFKYEAANRSIRKLPCRPWSCSCSTAVLPAWNLTCFLTCLPATGAHLLCNIPLPFVMMNNIV